MEFSIPEIIDNRYRVNEKIGSGAMATVYSAEDTRLGRQVALKILRPEHASDDTFRARFQREAESVAALNHPNIVGVYDTGVFESVQGDQSVQIPFLVMELLQGKTLRSILSERGELPAHEAIAYGAQVLEALQYAANAGIVHRDIKPANVMVLPRTDEDVSKNQFGQVKVMDFGIARAMEETDDSLTKANTVMGTARYISPEQARGETVDSRSDIYSAACLIYELLCGRSPFNADSNVDLAGKHLSETAQAPSTHARQTLSPALDAVLGKALAKSRQDRFQTPSDFRFALLDAEQHPDSAPLYTGEDTQPTTALAAASATGSTAAGVAAGGAAGYAAASSTDTAPPVEEAGLGGWFDNAQSEYTDEELYEYERNEALAKKKRRRQAWVRVLTGMLIAALALFSIGTVLYYQNELNRVPTHALPAMQGMEREEAANTLRNNNISVKWEEEYSDKIEKDHIIKTSPVTGMEVEEGSEVTLTVSKGPSKVKIPDNLSGQSEAYVRTALEQAGFVAGRTSTVNSASVPTGMVVATSPKAGEQVDAGSTVDIVLSNGKVQVPNVTGMTRDQAITALSDSKVMLSTNIETTQTNSAPAGTVVSQSAAAGSSVEQGSTVTITVAQTPTPTAAPVPTRAAPSASAPADSENSDAADLTPGGNPSPTPSASASAPAPAETSASPTPRVSASSRNR